MAKVQISKVQDKQSCMEDGSRLNKSILILVQEPFNGTMESIG
jgi:hypothetical protein